MNIKLLYPDSKIPTRGSEYAAGYDLYAHIENGPITIRPHDTVKIDTGIAVELPKNTFGGIFARSGLATRHGLRPSNCVGAVDADYRGPVIVALHNDSDFSQFVDNGQKIAQLIVIPYIDVDLKVVDTLSETVRGDGGFGSTGK